MYNPANDPRITDAVHEDRSVFATAATERDQWRAQALRYADDVRFLRGRHEAQTRQIAENERRMGEYRAALEAQELVHSHWEGCDDCQDDAYCEALVTLQEHANRLRWDVLGVTAPISQGAKTDV